MRAEEKAAGVLDTPATADRKQCPSSVFTAETLSNHDKRFATLRARAALSGVTLYAIEGDFGKTIYVVSRWALTKQLDSMDAAEAWLDQVTGGRE